VNWLDAMGWGGSALLVFSLLQSRVLRFRVLNLVACVILLVFNAAIEVWPMVGMNAVLSAINLWFIAKLVRESHDEAVFEVLRVRPDDAYLEHVLAGHSADIRKFQPDFGGLSDASIVYLVQKGDETVGIVVLHQDGDSAVIDLDYVGPRYRDFTPGEFVWRRSELLAQLGVRRVVTSPQMVGPYYSRLGFHEESGSFVLDVT